MIIIILLFALIGVYMLTGRGSFLIAGYNFMSEEDKSKYNEKHLCQFVGILMLITSIFIAFMEYTSIPEKFTVTGYLLVTITFIIFMNVSRKFRIR
ncbi:DUF3784 domain-containing protein [Macrococcus animalis]|uniref:DUF3784 domain-containing protein n=1 Tax=Macrococcus animalis TaxID=3395467 RepID=UPI0039BDBDC0